MSSLEALLNLLYPPKCPFCSKLLEKGELLCPDCQRELPWLTGPAGERAVELTQGCISPLRYQEMVRRAIHQYKFGGKSGRSRAFGALMAQCVVDHGWQPELVTWPSLSKKRLRSRGYDQARLLADAVGERMSLPVVQTLEKADRPAQSGLKGEAERRANVLGAYVPCHAERFRGKRILLVDDVVTTGATLAECARVLRLAGAEGVFCVTLARAG